MSEPRQFHLGDILSVTTGRLVSLSHVDGLYEILSFMTGESLFTHQLPRAMEVCKPALLAQHPQLDSPEIRSAVAGLDELIRGDPDRATATKLVAGWLSNLTAAYGETLPVGPLAAGAYEPRHPLAELAEMMDGTERIVVVGTDDAAAGATRRGRATR